MPFRDGSLSTFTTSPSGVDQFPILEPYDPESSTQNTNALLRANHINKYFDAALKIETSLWGNQGGALLPLTSTGTSPSTGIGNSLISYNLVTMSASSEVTTLALQVPAAFGSNPFQDYGFGIAHTAHFFTNMDTNLKTSLAGLWATKNYPPQTGIYNFLANSVQFYTVVEPGTGRNFNLHLIAKSYHSQAFSLDGTMSDDLESPSYPANPNSLNWNLESGSNNAFSVIYDSDNDKNRLRISSATGGIKKGGALTARTRTSDNVTIRFKSFYSSKADSLSNPETTNECYCRVGPVINFYGDITNCSFYGLIFGDVPISASNPGGKDKRLWARLVKVTNHNLLTGGNDNSTTWGGDTGSQVTDLLGAYIDFDDPAITDIRFVKTGNNLTVEKSLTNGSSWAVAAAGLPLTVGSPLQNISNGQSPRAGFVAKAMDGETDRYLEFGAEISVTPQDPSFAFECKVNLLYLSTKPESSFTPLVDYTG